jgi:hypothetical protein
MLVSHRNSLPLFFVSVICVLAAAPPSAKAVIVSSWELGNVADNSSDPPFDFRAHTVVQNPLLHSHISTAVPSSFAQAAYDFIWSELNASFQTTVSHQAHDVPSSSSLLCQTTGFIFVQPSFDSVLSVQGSYTYALPPESFITRFTVIVRDMNTNISIWSDSRVANSFGGNPVSGTFAIANEAIPLIGGHTYRLHYSYRLDALGGGTNSTGTGNGGILWTINPVPEVDSLSLLTCSIPLLFLRRRFS